MPRTPPEDYQAEATRRGFELGEWLGGGAYGNVYKAKQDRLGRTVAVKFYDNKNTRGDAAKKRFDREAQLLARVQHPAIPYVLTTGAVPRKPEPILFTVMEFISGKGLDKRLASGPKLTPDEVFGVLRDVLSALSSAHELHVVHRDVKPDNIILTAKGRCTYLIDFSIGVCLEYEPGLTRATRAGEVVGTTNYAAPEQLIDSSNVDGRSDVYAAGAVLAEMLGARPRIKLDRLDQELVNVAPEVKAIVRRACAENPSDRYATADAFLGALDRIIGPRTMGLLDERLVVCPNFKCGGVAMSSGGKYVWGPKITGPTAEPFCRHCGTEYLRGCPSCRVPLPDNVAELVSKKSKTDPDALEAHCPRCGAAILVVPTCEKCRSYLQPDDIGMDTRQLGCNKCRRRTATARWDSGGGYGGGAGSGAGSGSGAGGGGGGGGGGSDDDIPF